MPFVQSNFQRSPYLFNGHVETIIPALFRNVEVGFSRERITLPDGDFLDLDWIKNGNRQLLVLLHGLEGSSQSQYVKGFAKFFNERGWDICAMNHRSCSGEMNRLLRSYHSGDTEDVEAVIRHIRSGQVYQQIGIVGFSLGGNMLLKYLGEQGEQLPPEIKVACAFSVPVHLASSSVEMAKFHNRVYLIRFLKTLVAKMKYKAVQFPGQVDISGIDAMKTFLEFDNRFTAPMHGFINAADYYERCSAINFLPAIRIPTLLVNALNDPFLSPACFPQRMANQLSFLHLETPAHGGHVGFIEDFSKGKVWSELRAYAFVKNVLFQ
jgi:predicted alpha/beta-fold hydrolase